jgi:hypothetical protein
MQEGDTHRRASPLDVDGRGGYRGTVTATTEGRNEHECGKDASHRGTSGERPSCPVDITENPKGGRQDAIKIRSRISPGKRQRQFDG